MFQIPSSSDIEGRISDLQNTNPTRYKIYKFLWKNIWIQYWFDIILAILIVIANYYPNFARHGGIIKGQYTIGYGAVIIIFLGSGLSMQTEELLKNILHWRAHLTVFLLQFLITSSIIYGFACAIKSTESSLISKWMLVGLIVTGCCPTTVSSNVVMTRKADGNVLLTLCEVFLGNIAGAFITPALVQMYFRGEWQFANPANGNSIGIVYKNVIKQVGISVFIPLIVGQVIQNLFPKKTKWFLSTFKINKVGSLMLLLLMFSSFSTAFYQHAFESVTNESIIFMIIFDIGIYLLFTVICFIMSRPYLMHKMFEKIPDESTSKIYNFFYHIIKPFYYNREDTISVLLCGGAKTAALGVTLISSQYGDNNEHLGELLVPLVLYQAIQVITAGFLTPFMKKWVHDGPQYKLKLQEEEETTRIRLQEEEVGLLANQSNEEIIPNQSENDLISSNKVNLKNTPQNYGSSSNT